MLATSKNHDPSTFLPSPTAIRGSSSSSITTAKQRNKSIHSNHLNTITLSDEQHGVEESGKREEEEESKEKKTKSRKTFVVLLFDRKIRTRIALVCIMMFTTLRILCYSSKTTPTTPKYNQHIIGNHGMVVGIPPKTTNQIMFDESIKAERNADYGTPVLLGQYPLSPNVIDCVAYYPAIELQNYITKDEAVSALMRRFGGGFLRANFENNDDVVVMGGDANDGESAEKLPPPPPSLPLLTSDHADARYLHNTDMAILTRRSYKGGLVTNQVNQDSVVIVSPFLPKPRDVHTGLLLISEETLVVDDKNKQHDFLLCIFDGHGNFGHATSHFAVIEFPRLLSSKLHKQQQTKPTTIIIQQIITETFLEINASVPSRSGSGCTASTILRLGSKIYIANAGDSRTFLVLYTTSTNTIKIVYSNRLDKPHLPEERTRIERMGGQVYIPLTTSESSRVIVQQDASHIIGLAMSRSIGDVEAERFGVIADPIVDVVDIHEQMGGLKDDDVHMFAVGATDGLMDHVSMEQVAMELASSLYGGETKKQGGGVSPLVACERLIQKASELWIKNGEAYRDDISVAVTKVILT